MAILTERYSNHVARVTPDPAHPLSNGMNVAYLMRDVLPTRFQDYNTTNKGPQTIYDWSGCGFHSATIGYPNEFSGFWHHNSIGPCPIQVYYTNITVGGGINSRWPHPTSWTSSLWVRDIQNQNGSETDEGGQYWMERIGMVNEYWAIKAGPSRKITLQYRAGSGNPMGISSTTTVTTAINDWNLVTGVRDLNAGKVLLYVNGKLENEVSFSTSYGQPVPCLLTRLGSVTFGQACGPFWNWTRALSAQEVALHYQDPLGPWRTNQNKTALFGSAASALSGGPFPHHFRRRMSGGMLTMRGF